MKLKQLGSNKTVVSYDNGLEVFFSYETPVAAYCPNRGYIKTKTNYSRTTSKHINQWLPGSALEVDQTELNGLTA